MRVDFWNKAPFLRLVIPLILGVVLEIQEWISLSIVLPLFITSLVGFSILALYPRQKIGLKVNVSNGALGVLAIISAGFIISWASRTSNYTTHFSKHVEEDSFLIAEIIEPPQEKKNSVKAFLRIEEVRKNGRSSSVIGNLLVYFEKDSVSLNLSYGDRVVIQALPQEVGPPDNPEQFNFKRYLANQDIYHQTYVPADDWKLFERRKGMYLRHVAFDIRSAFMEILSRHIKTEGNMAIASALILGYKEDLDPETLRSFSSAGAMHVLAVSGLHVGIIFLLMNFILKPLDRVWKYGNWIRAIALLVVLWMYAFITGLSPSVMRASTMFSFIVIGDATKRQTNIYNTLSCSAFILILYDPLIITKVGFQLSYFAVLGIVYLQPKMYAWLNFNNWLLDKVWAITCVSFAAQLATFPLGLYYFHQFPNYFFVSNLLVIPMATIILYGGIALIIFHYLNIAEAINWFVDGCITLLKRSVVFVEEIPYSLMYGNFINEIELVLLYVAVMLFLAWIAVKRPRWLIAFMSVTVLLLILSAKDRYRNAHQRQIIVYNVPKKTVVNFLTGTSNVIVADKEFNSDDSQQLYYVKHYWYSRGFLNATFITGDENYHQGRVVKHKNLIEFEKERVMLVSNKDELTLLQYIPADVVLIGGNEYYNPQEISTYCKESKVVLDSSMPSYKAQKLAEKLRQLDVDVYDIQEENALILNL